MWKLPSVLNNDKKTKLKKKTFLLDSLNINKSGEKSARVVVEVVVVVDDGASAAVAAAAGATVTVIVYK